MPKNLGQIAEEKKDKLPTDIREPFFGTKTTQNSFRTEEKLCVGLEKRAT